MSAPDKRVKKLKKLYLPDDPSSTKSSPSSDKDTSDDDDESESNGIRVDLHPEITSTTSLINRVRHSHKAEKRVTDITIEDTEITKNISISKLRQFKNFFGESPFYHQSTDRVYWVDILKNTLNYWQNQTGQMGRWDLKIKVGCAVPIRNNPSLFLIATIKGPALFDTKCETWSHFYN